MTRKFDSLRTTPWNPTFTWVETALEAADRINSFHEDYPLRVNVTQQMLELPFRGFPKEDASKVYSEEIQSLALGSIHWFVFNDHARPGQWREANVVVGGLPALHRPPDWELLPKLMYELEQHYQGKVRTVEDLQDWYEDMETIHPFIDGNGRVGGVIVATFAHARHPEKGWLAPNQ